MSQLDSLIKYFPTGTTEGDRNILKDIFVSPEQLPEVLAIPSGSPRIIVGNKGIGKTAILEWLFNAAKKKRIPTLFLRPDDIELSVMQGVSDVATIKRNMYSCFLDAVATGIAQNLSGYLKGPAAKLYNESVAKGSREADWVGKLLSVLSKISTSAGRIDAKSLAADLAKTSSSESELAQTIQNHLLDEEKVFLLLLDDTDQVATLDDPNHLNRIWGLLLAVRKLTSTSPNIKCIVTLRTEVWMRLLRNEKGQRDQIDHFRPLVLSMRAPERLMKTILNKRIEKAAYSGGCSGRPPFLHFFEEDWMNLPTSTERRSWEQFLLKSSRERPRDMIQLVHHLASAAKARGADRIASTDAEYAMQSFSKERAEDLAIEMGFDCASFLDVLRSFVDLDFELEFDQLRDHLKALPSRFSLVVFGRAMKPSDEDDAIKILSLLHESGFINPRVTDKRMPDNYRHCSGQVISDTSIGVSAVHFRS
ncbi:P-loop ATPase, Sll1717 family [Thioalkalivibrio sp. ALJ16]|uniref:P-loop ATPase, Sll1717 family n=1 Tax=Thioalkalivibrio sp. ALJ16 TaxID=1158762 RepID=UPI0003A554D7|nr:hypothetical protein [Thioalkalivibrio sp. ALJ16]